MIPYATVNDENIGDGIERAFDMFLDQTVLEDNHDMRVDVYYSDGGYSARYTDEQGEEHVFSVHDSESGRHTIYVHIDGDPGYSAGFRFQEL